MMLRTSSHWCKFMDLDMMELVHCRARIPVLPYIGHLAIAVIQDDEDSMKDGTQQNDHSSISS